MLYFVTIGERVVEVDLGSDGIRIDGEGVEVDLLEMDGTEVQTLLLNNLSHRILASRRSRGVWSLYLSGRHLRAQVEDERTRIIREMVGSQDGSQGPRVLKAPMPGLVVKVEAQEGDLVFAGQGLVIVEAMKMENELKSEGDGRVTRVAVAPGQTVEKDQVLLEFDPAEVQDQKGSEE